MAIASALSGCDAEPSSVDPRDALGGADANLVVEAIDQLLHEHDMTVEGALGAIPDERLVSHVWFANVAFALEERALRGGSGAWPRQVREQLSARVSSARGIAPPPTVTADMELNRRISLEGGSFMMEDAYTVTLSPFTMQEHEVTNREYRRFHPSHDPDAPEDHPVRQVNWYEAMAYAAWLGGSLPTEAQWELAARGVDGRVYPWGDEPPTPMRANYGAADVGGPSPVKTYPEGATPDGIYDLAGNVFEWCRDWHGVRGDDPTDPLGPEEGLTRTIRGGSFRDPASYIRSLIHTHTRPDGRAVRVGFRVAWPAASESS